MKRERFWIGILAGLTSVWLVSAVCLGTIELIELGASRFGDESPLRLVETAHQKYIATENRDGYWPYTFFGGLGLLVTIGLSVTFAVAERKSLAWRRYACYVGILILLQFSLFYNMAYGAGDVLISRTVQAALNVLILLLSSVCALLLYPLRTVSVEGKVLKALTLAFLCFFGIVGTTIITMLWFLNQINMLSLKQAEAFSPAWIAAVSGVVSSAVGYLNYRHSTQKVTEPEKVPEKSLIIQL